MDEKKSFFRMNGAGDTKWLIMAAAVPLTILFFIFFDTFFVLKSQFNPYQLTCWAVFGLVLLGLSIGYFVYSIIRIIQKKEVHTVISIIIILTYTAYLYTIAFFINKMLTNIPQWMFDPVQGFKYIGSFMIPGLFYALFLGQKFLKNVFKEKKIWVNFIIVLAIPLFWFIFNTFILRHITAYIWQKKLYDTAIYRIGVQTAAIFCIILLLSFFFFLIRGLISLFKNKINIINKLKFLWIGLFCLVFPVLGLLLNECYFPFSFLKNKMSFVDIFHMIFGNFSNPLFFICAIANGLLLLIPNFSSKLLRLILFSFRMIMFAFTTYLFIALLPFYPFFIFAILIFGAGFLIISPVILLIIHVQIIKEDIKYLKEYLSNKIILLIAAVSLLILPSMLISNFLYVKSNLYKALSFTYYPDYDRNSKIKINIKALNDSLIKIEEAKKGQSFFNGSDTTNMPYITALYKKIVLNNLTLSEQKINDLRCLFNGQENTEYSKNQSSNDPEKSDINIINLDCKTEVDKNAGLYTTWVNLDLKNHVSREFITNINLPDGVWINDYYLYVNGRKKTGLLREKKSVMWVYEQIKTVRRDPGIMYYINDKTITLKVFPFAPNETRKTGFKIVHIEPLEIKNIDNRIILSTINKLENPVVSNNKDIIYFPVKFKDKLETVQRKAYYHFIIDCSLKSKYMKSSYIDAIKKLLDKKNISNENAMITLTGYNTETFKLSNDFENKILNYKNSGGFNLDRALKTVIYNNFKNNESRSPAIVVVTNNIFNAVYNNDIADFASFVPDIDCFYTLDMTGNIYKNDFNNFLRGNSYNFKTDKIIIKSMLKWKSPEINKNIYINKNNEPSLVPLYTDKNDDKNKIEKTNITINNLLSLQALYNYKILHPEKTNQAFKKIFTDSVKMNVLNPLTSFVVLEDEAQEKMLLKKQKDVLNGEKFLDTGDVVKEMPEPSFVILSLLLLFALLMINFIRRKKNN